MSRGFEPKIHKPNKLIDSWWWWWCLTFVFTAGPPVLVGSHSDGSSNDRGDWKQEKHRVMYFYLYEFSPLTGSQPTGLKMSPTWKSVCVDCPSLLSSGGNDSSLEERQREVIRENTSLIRIKPIYSPILTVCHPSVAGALKVWDKAF